MKDKAKLNKLCGSRRLLLSFIGFLGSFHLYAMRMNLSVGILCMTNYTAVDSMLNKSNFIASPLPLLYTSPSPTDINNHNNATASSCQLSSSEKYKDGPFAWSKEVRGSILGVFFWGYLISQIPAGYLATKYSAKWLLFSFMLMATLSVIFLPLAAIYGGVWVVCMLRVLCGLASGVFFPCMHQMWSRWAPPQERSLLVGFAYSGLHCGNAFTLPIAGLLCEYGFSYGWDSIFYLTGVFGLVWCVIWAVLVDDSPQQCRSFITTAEREYIVNSLSNQLETDQSKSPSFMDIPWRSIVTSKPLWAIVVVNVLFDWNGYTFLTSTPTYMKDVLKFNMTQNGFTSALPFIGMGVCQVIFAMLCDLLQRKHLLTITRIRKLMVSIGMLTPAVVVVILAYLTCVQRSLAVCLLTLGISCTAGLFVGALVNHVDLAPQYSGLLFGITNTMGSFTGFFSSYFVQAVTKNNSIDEWRIVFFVCAVLYVVGAVVYLIIGSAELQPWAFTHRSGDDDSAAQLRGLCINVDDKSSFSVDKGNLIENDTLKTSI